MADFANWLNQELDLRGWSRSEAARRGGFSPSMFDKVVGGYANPGLDFCRGIARAFQVPLEDVFRLAGILPARADINERKIQYRVGRYVMRDRLVQLFERLNGDQQELVIRLLESMAPSEARIIGDAPEEEG